MVFNWFRRQNNKSSDNSSEQKQEQTAVEKDVTTESTETPTTESSPEVTTDLLAFAKAAYKNIQEKQQTTQSTEESTSEPSVEVEEKVSQEVAQSLPEVTDIVAESEEVAQSPQEVTEIVNESEEVAQKSIQAQQLETTTPTEDSIEEDVILETEEPVSLPSSFEDLSQPTDPANLSFLERARLEREARQEKLVKNATEVSEPSKIDPTVAEVSADTREEVVEQIPELAFDEGFLWSTEVLAAQGRRAEDVSIEEITWLQKLRQGLDKTRRSLINQLKAIVGKGPLNASAVEEIEALLLQADVGVEATDYIINALQEKLRQEALPPEEGIAYLKKILRDMLDKPLQDSDSVSFTPEKESFNIWLITGVNGAGKTTTIGKIAHLASKSGYKCLIGAADTFRAAAVQQVTVWGERSGVEVIANPGKNTDPAAVVFDAIAAAVSRETELLLVDTAGRLQNKKNLMEELSKIRRIIHKKAPNAKVESLLVLDATLGQNGLRQAEVFSQAAELSGVVLTKLDGTAKGGVALAVVQQLGLPIRFIGAGEGIEDLRPFSSYEFVEALLSG
jgi:fused signal recognition particle receptor